MGKQVFLSVLGTGFYNKCVYSHEASGFKSVPTRYIQEATIDFLGVEKWSERDAVYIFTTPQAKANNWDKSISVRRRFAAAAEEEYVGLEQVLADKHLKARVEGVDISNGMDETEMWQVFSTIYGKLERGDRLYIDLTHGFRYLPMLVLVLCQYARLLKNVSVQSITYGNFEARNSDGESPLMDLCPLSTLQDLTIGVGSFKDFGKMANLSSVFGRMGDAGKARKLFSNIFDAAKGIDTALSTCRGQSLQQAEHFSAMGKAIAEVQKLNLPGPVMELLGMFADQISGFGQAPVGNLCAAVEWCVRYGMVQQGYTLCQESIVTCLCDYFRTWNPWRESEAAEDEKRFRNLVSQTIGLSQKSAEDERTWRGDLAEHKSLVHFILGNPYVKELRGSYSVLTHYRNQINHAGFIAPVKGTDLQKNLKSNAARCMEILRQIRAEGQRPAVNSDEPICTLADRNTGMEGQKPAAPLLVNLSNHPYAGWSQAQKDAARDYGECVDVPFPSVDPSASNAEMESSVAEYEARIMAYADKCSVLTVHVMGEMTFCFSLVGRLKARGIRCIASCAKREVEEMDDERIKSVYNFIRFREYE